MTIKIYVDESGNTGESLVYEGKALFGNQPYFCLAAVAINKSDELEKSLLALKKKYNIQMSEFKATKIIKKKPRFFEDYFQILKDFNVPIFIEFMNKKYYFATSIINSLIFPCNELPPEIVENANFFQVQRILANKLYNILSIASYQFFSNLCLVESEANFNLAINSIASDIVESKDSDLYSVLQHLKRTQDSIADIYSSNPDSHMKQFYRPLPDLGTKRDLFLMTHVSSIMSLVPRFQHYAKTVNVDSISIIHDEQSHYDVTLKNTLHEMNECVRQGGDEVLKKMSKAILSAKNLDGYEEGFNNPNMLFDIPKNGVSISFEVSKNELGIQMADLVAGFMNYTWKYFKNNKKLPSYAVKPYKYIFNIWKKEPSMGCNFVVPDEDYNQLQNSL